MDEIIMLAVEKLNISGYSAEYDDLIFYANCVYQEIKNRLGTQEVPCELNYLLANMVAGLYMQDSLSKDAGNGVVTSIKEGDISVSYKNGKSVWEMTSDMANSNEEQLAVFRRIVW